MSYMRKWLVAFGLGFFALAAFASPAAPQNGTDYITLENPQPTDTGGKVEVIEFFGYFCSACNALDPALKEWKDRQGSNIVFKRVAVGFGDATVPQQKLFYTLSAMGKLEELHPKIFHALHVERLPLRNDEQIFSFVERNGVDRARFIETYNSFAIDSYTRAAKQLQALFKVDGVPMVAIDGRYLTSLGMIAKGSPSLSYEQAQAATLKVMDALVARAKQEKRTRSVVLR